MSTTISYSFGVCPSPKPQGRRSTRPGAHFGGPSAAGTQPVLETPPDLRPFRSEDREVRGIPRLAVHCRLERAQHAVEMRAQPFDGPARAVVALVGLQR